MNVASQRVIPTEERDKEREFVASAIMIRLWPEARSADAYRQHLRYALHLETDCYYRRFLWAWNEAGRKLGRRR